jgi:hypothetical protein
MRLSSGPRFDPGRWQYVCNRVDISEDGGNLVSGDPDVVFTLGLLAK